MLCSRSGWGRLWHLFTRHSEKVKIHSSCTGSGSVRFGYWGTTRRLHIIDAAIFDFFFCITSICDMSEDDTVVWCSDIR
jgi:hypothetical protein